MLNKKRKVCHFDSSGREGKFLSFSSGGTVYLLLQAEPGAGGETGVLVSRFPLQSVLVQLRLSGQHGAPVVCGPWLGPVGT